MKCFAERVNLHCLCALSRNYVIGALHIHLNDTYKYFWRFDGQYSHTLAYLFQINIYLQNRYSFTTILIYLYSSS